LRKSAIVLSGGFSNRFGQDKGIVLLAGKPLVRHVLDAVGYMANERIVVASSEVQAEKLAKIVGSSVKVVVDIEDLRSPLVGALTGFKEARSEYSLLLSCDVPLVSQDVLLLLLDLCTGKSAVVPRWPNCYIEPLQAVYRTDSTLKAAEKALCEGKLNMQSMVDKLRGVRYVSTLVLRQLDPELRTFFNVNTPVDLKKAESLLKQVVR
jgi:molybdopterin-guanine dinucleotide biosynthesis protein A